MPLQTEDDHEDPNEEEEEEFPEYDLSASRIKTFRSCPEKFRMKYVAGMDGTKQPKGYGVLGGMVHRAIEDVLEHASLTTLTNKNQLTGRLKTTFSRVRDDTDTEHVDSKQISDGISCLEVAARFIAKYMSEHGDTIRDIEGQTVYNITNHRKRLDVDILGYIDVTTDGEIWDWKTGRVRGEDTEIEEKIQGSIYMAGYHNLYGEMPERVRFIYLKEEEQHILEASEANWNEMLKWASRLVKAKERGEFEAKPEDGKCHFCSYEPFCGGTPAGFGQVEHWDQF